MCAVAACANLVISGMNCWLSGTMPPNSASAFLSSVLCLMQSLSGPVGDFLFDGGPEAFLFGALVSRHGADLGAGERAAFPPAASPVRPSGRASAPSSAPPRGGRSRAPRAQRALPFLRYGWQVVTEKNSPGVLRRDIFRHCSVYAKPPGPAAHSQTRSATWGPEEERSCGRAQHHR
jgi:hypothetical protein